MKVLVWSVLCWVAVMGSSAWGDSVRCGGKLVSTGDSRMDVLAACGLPDHSEVVSYKTTVRESGPGRAEAETRKVEKLYYNCGEGRFTRILSIMDGKLVRIESGGYGSGPGRCE